MEDVWFGPGFARRDVEAFLLALAQAKPQPLIAIAAKQDTLELVIASRAFFDLFDVETGAGLAERLLTKRDPGARRLASLARTLSLGGTPRLERLRFALASRSEPVTFLCRRIATEGGGTVLVAAAQGLQACVQLVPLFEKGLSAAEPVPGIGSAVAMPDRAEAAVDSSVSSGAAPEDDTATRALAADTMTVQAIQATLRSRWPSSRTIRFLWQTDADTVCTQVTPPLAEVVGITNADLVGRNLLELAPTLDPSGRLANALAKRQTWSGLDVAWPMTDAPAAVTVGLGAVPAFDREHAFEGYRGYGVIHLDRLIARDAMRLAPTSLAAPRTEPPATNVVAFPGQKTLSAEDQLAFDALAMELRDKAGIVPHDRANDPQPDEALVEAAHVGHDVATLAHASAAAIATTNDGALPLPQIDAPVPAAVAAPPRPVDHAPTSSGRAELLARNGLSVIDRLAVGLLVTHDNVPVFANRHLLDLLGFADEAALCDAGGLSHLFGGLPANVSGSEAVGVRASDGSIVPSNARMQRIDWDGAPAILLTLQQTPDAAQTALDAAQRAAARHDQAQRASEEERRQSVAATMRDHDELRELRAILETAADGIAVIDGACNVLSLNGSAEALFGCERGDVVGKPFLDLFAAHNQDLASDYFEGIKSSATKSLLNDGRAILVRTRQGGTIPVFMTLGSLGAPSATSSGEQRAGARFCALFRDLTQWKKVEGELEAAKVAAERASALKTDFLAKVSHEVRTPLNAIIGFAEVIMEERFGPVGNDRYRDYLRDIHASGTHVMSLVNDLLDLSKIEAGKMELADEEIDANKVIGECVAIMQPQASRERVIMRLSLARGLPRIRVDERSLRQIVLNLLSNAVKFNEPGGQVIVATTLTDAGQAVIRIRDTGPGMSDEDIAAAMEPFRQLSSRHTAGGTGLGLPLTKALVEANHATLAIRSKVDQGTLVEVVFPPARVLAG